MSLLPEQEYIVNYLMKDVLNLDIINSNVCLDNKYRFCFGTLDKVSYHTTNLMPLGKTIEEAIKKAIDEKIDVDVILDREDKMLR